MDYSYFNSSYRKAKIKIYCHKPHQACTKSQGKQKTKENAKELNQASSKMHGRFMPWLQA